MNEHCNDKYDVVKSWLGDASLSEYPYHVIREIAKGCDYEDRSPDNRKYKVIEDNAGGLHLFVFNAVNEVIYARSGCEYVPEQLKDDIKALKYDTDIFVSDWEDCVDDPQEYYDSFTPVLERNGAWKLVADNGGIYPNNMGVAARIQFGIECD